MENNNGKNSEASKCAMCQGHDLAHCGMCAFCHFGKHRLAKWLIAFIVLVIVFWAGLKLGELKGRFEGEFGNFYGYPMMNWYGNSDNSYQVPNMMRNMMRGWGGYYYGSTTAPR